MFQFYRRWIRRGAKFRVFISQLAVLFHWNLHFFEDFLYFNCWFIRVYKCRHFIADLSRHFVAWRSSQACYSNFGALTMRLVWFYLVLLYAHLIHCQWHHNQWNCCTGFVSVLPPSFSDVKSEVRQNTIFESNRNYKSKAVYCKGLIYSTLCTLLRSLSSFREVMLLDFVFRISSTVVKNF